MSLEDLLAEHVLGTLAAEDSAELEAALLDSPALRAEHDALADVIARIGLAVAPVAPSDAARARLFGAVEREGRFAPFVARLGALFDLPRARIEALIAAMADAASWTPGPGSGIRLMHFEAGPRALAVDAGFVRVPAGAVFPGHLHTGRERALVLEGAFQEVESGLVVRAGEHSEREAGTSHTFRALPGPDLLFAVVLEGDIEMVP